MGKATQRFGAPPLNLLLAAYFGMVVGVIIGNWLFPDYLGRKIARQNVEKREQYEMYRKASVEDTIKTYSREREYYNRQIERLRSWIAVLKEQDVAISFPVAAKENQESTRDVGGVGQV